ncbi:hypothetical protein RDABS01_013825 [Bienertia sinuspersici]
MERTKQRMNSTCTYKKHPIKIAQLLILGMEEDKNLFWFEKHPLVLLSDYKRWNHPTSKKR